MRRCGFATRFWSYIYNIMYWYAKKSSTKSQNKINENSFFFIGAKAHLSLTLEKSYVEIFSELGLVCGGE